MNINVDFENIKNKASDAAKYAKKKATVLAGIAKANVLIFAEEDKVKKAQAELGRLYYNDFVSGNSADTEAYLPICNRITESKDTIQDLRATIARLKAQAAAVQEESAGDDEVTDADFVVPGEEEAVAQEMEEEPKETSSEEKES